MKWPVLGLTQLAPPANSSSSASPPRLYLAVSLFFYPRFSFSCHGLSFSTPRERLCFLEVFYPLWGALSGVLCDRQTLRPRIAPPPCSTMFYPPTVVILANSSSLSMVGVVDGSKNDKVRDLYLFNTDIFYMLCLMPSSEALCTPLWVPVAFPG